MSKFAALALATDEAQRMTILHPVTRVPLRDQDGNDAYIALLSTDSAAAVNIIRQQNDRRLRRRGSKTSAEVDQDVIEFFAALTTGWRLLTLDGEPFDIPFSTDAARDLYSELLWIREQVDAFVGDRGNFQRAQSTI